MTYIKAKKHPELKPSDLKWTCDTKIFDFDSTTTIKPHEEIIGQKRAIKSLKIGVDLKSQGYNIFITGLSGTGKYTTIKRMLETISPQCPILSDYAYVNNFNDVDRPTLLTFPAGKAKKFKNDLNSAIKFFQENIPQVLEQEPFITKKKKLFAQYGQTQQKLMVTFEEKLRKDNFTLGQVKVGEMAHPEILMVVDGKPVFIAQLDDLIRQKKITKKKASQIAEKYAAYQGELQNIFRKSLSLNKEFQQKISDLEKKAVSDLIRVTLDEIKNKYKNNAVNKYLSDVGEDILQNLDIFKGQRPSQEKTDGGLIVDYLKDYEVNIVLDNSNVKECPVIIETTPTYSNIFGTIEKYSDGTGGWYADFTRIKAGSLLRANGGYLVINALDAFSEVGVWKSLKRVMLHGKLAIQDLGNLYQFSPSILKPEPIEINTKIIFIGNNYIYSVLSEYEDDFNKIFKIKSEFDYEMKRTDQALIEYAGVIKKLIQSEKLLEFDRSAIGKIVELGARYAGEKNKLTTRFAYIADLAREASFWAVDNGEKIVSAYHVQQAYDYGKERHGLYESKLKEMIVDNTILIDTEGERVGQINGLAVYGGGHYSFGKPTRITAAVSLGTGNILNVEREAGLSGNTYNKGVLIISGYFREKFGKKIPLSFKASLVFEQGYGKIDGDSASITEICVLLSCLSGVPIKQSFAITGSVNQKGDIQPIGGVNEKIEGFFEICKSRKLTKKQGVIIPKQNVKDLMLRDEVVEAVKNKEFHIYAISAVEEAIEILTGVKAAELTKSGWYRANTVFGLVEKNLKEMRNRVKPSRKSTHKKKSKKTIKKEK